MSPDVFGTADLRAAVLEAWRLSPARLREDANLEEDHARGYYRDRVLVELAQNASDAAVRAGVPGRLLLRLTHAADGPPDATDEGLLERSAGPVLVAANTGAPLDAAGVASLASLRASAKRAGGLRGPGAVVGRFGVGFAAVRAVADDVSVLSTSGGVRFSLPDTRALLDVAGAEVPALAQEVHRRDGSLPALRLPWPVDGRPPTGYDTAVVLRLRDEVAADEVRALLAQVGDPLLLGLPGLVEIVVEDLTSSAPARRVTDAGARWHVVSGEGELDAHLLAGRPVEERGARAWRVTWAVPRAGADVGWDPVMHAPTPTDEPCTVPALLVATLPLDPSRRHVADGPATEAVLEHAAVLLAGLAHELARAGEDPLGLVPTGLASGALDQRLRDRVVARMAATPLLATHDGGEGGLVAPDRAVAVGGALGRDPGAVAALARVVPDLVRVPPGREAQARLLGVEVRALVDVVDQLAERPAGAVGAAVRGVGCGGGRRAGAGGVGRSAGAPGGRPRGAGCAWHGAGGGRPRRAGGRRGADAARPVGAAGRGPRRGRSAAGAAGGVRAGRRGAARTCGGASGGARAGRRRRPGAGRRGHAGGAGARRGRRHAGRGVAAEPGRRAVRRPRPRPGRPRVARAAHAACGRR
ncbi:sacsin N-terminal ATP-binding-like domain-containing protein [Cellulomonas soli]